MCPDRDGLRHGVRRLPAGSSSSSASPSTCSAPLSSAFRSSATSSRRHAGSAAIPGSSWDALKHTRRARLRPSGSRPRERRAPGVEWDGASSKVACWVRRVEGDRFQVFAVDSAHLRLPGALVPTVARLLHVSLPRERLLRGRLARVRAAPRGASGTKYEIRDGHLWVRGGDHALGPGLIAPGLIRGRMRLFRVGQQVDRGADELEAAVAPVLGHQVPRSTASWWYVFGSATLALFAPADRHRGYFSALVSFPSADKKGSGASTSTTSLHSAGSCGPSISGAPTSPSDDAPHDPGLPLRRPQVSARDNWVAGVFLALHSRHGLHRPDPALEQDAYWGLRGSPASIAARAP